MSPFVPPRGRRTARSFFPAPVNSPTGEWWDTVPPQMIAPTWEDDGRPATPWIGRTPYYAYVGPGWQPILHQLGRQLQRLGYRFSPHDPVWFGVRDGALFLTFPRGMPPGVGTGAWRAFAAAQRLAASRCELCLRPSRGVPGGFAPLRLCAYHWALGENPMPGMVLRTQAWYLLRSGTGCLRALMLGVRLSTTGFAQALLELGQLDDGCTWLVGESGWLSLALLTHALLHTEPELLRRLKPVDFLPLLSHSQQELRLIGMRLFGASHEAHPEEMEGEDTDPASAIAKLPAYWFEPSPVLEGEADDRATSDAARPQGGTP